MSYLKFICTLLVVFGFSTMAIGQTDDINITAAFSSSIDCTVTDGANISFTVATLDDYTNGLSDPSAYNSTFEVNSSVDFKVDLTSTDFNDGNGNTLDAENFGYTIQDNGNHQAGTNHKLLGGNASPSPVALLGTNEEIVTASGDGNAGNAADNSFVLKFELGTAAVRAESGLGTLLSQNIAPGTYTSTVTITASAMP